MQASDGLGIRVTLTDTGRTAVTFRGEGGRYVRQGLGLPPGNAPVILTPAQSLPSAGELTITGRSFLGVLTFLFRHIEALPAHRDAGLVVACAEQTRAFTGPLFRIRSSRSKPSDAFVAVQYRDHWFSIADNDLDSKATFV